MKVYKYIGIAVLSFLLGYAIGHAQAISFCVEVGSKLLEKKGIEINTNLIKFGIERYSREITQWLN